MSEQPLNGIRIGLLTASASRLGGGVFEAVVHQAHMIRELGGEALVFAAGDAFSEVDAERLPPDTAIVAPTFGPAQIAFAPALPRLMERADLDCLHLHGVWQWPTRAANIWHRRTRRPTIVSPHNMFDPWLAGNGVIKKVLARRAWLNRALRDARFIHALTEKEADDIRAETGRGDPVVIPNAGPPVGPMTAMERAHEFLYLGRIHPIKNLEAVIGGWSISQTNAGSAHLTIAGWGQEGDVASLRARLAEGYSSIRFVGGVFGEAKQALLHSSRFLVAPSHSEGLPMAVLEAWAAGTPTLMSAACNLGIGFRSGAAIDCGTTAESVAAALNRAMAMPEAEWQAMSRAARALAAGPFSAGVVAAQWAAAYRQAIRGFKETH